MPPTPIQQLRDLTRDLTALTPQLHRVERVLEDAVIKLSSVASDLNGVSCQAMFAALIAGKRNPKVLAEMARARCGPSCPKALTSRFSEHHAFRLGVLLDEIDHLTESVATYDAQIEATIEPYRWFRDLITADPGIGSPTADVITAATGEDRPSSPPPSSSRPGPRSAKGRFKVSAPVPGVTVS